MIIGFSGRAGAGKTTAANYLEHLGFVKDAYASTLKQAVSAMFGVPMEVLLGDKEVKDQFDPYWDMTYRKMLQLFGTEACRHTFGADVWERALWRRHPISDLVNLVIDDVRFPNEAEAILSRGGHIIEICRPMAETFDSHSSETPLEDALISYRLDIHGGISYLALAVSSVLDRIGRK